MRDTGTKITPRSLTTLQAAASTLASDQRRPRSAMIAATL